MRKGLQSNWWTCPQPNADRGGPLDFSAPWCASHVDGSLAAPPIRFPEAVQHALRPSSTDGRHVVHLDTPQHKRFSNTACNQKIVKSSRRLQAYQMRSSPLIRSCSSMLLQMPPRVMPPRVIAFGQQTRTLFQVSTAAVKLGAEAGRGYMRCDLLLGWAALVGAVALAAGRLGGCCRPREEVACRAR